MCSCCTAQGAFPSPAAAHGQCWLLALTSGLSCGQGPSKGWECFGQESFQAVLRTGCCVPPQCRWFPSGFASCAPCEQLQHFSPRCGHQPALLRGSGTNAPGTAGSARPSLGKVHKSSSVWRWAPRIRIRPTELQHGKPHPPLPQLPPSHISLPS